MYFKAWRYYLSFYSGLKWKLVFHSIMLMGQALLLLPVAMIIKYIFDRLIPERQFKLLFVSALFIFILYLVSNALSLWSRNQTLKITKSAIQGLRDELLKKIFSFSRSFYSQTDRNRLQNIIVQDTERLDCMTNALIALFLPSLLITVFLGIILLFLDWYLFLLLALIIPILYFSGKSLGKKVKTQINAFHKKFEEFNKGISLILRILDLTKVQTAEDLEIKRQQNQHDELRITSGKMVWVNTLYRLIQNMIVVSSGVIILVMGGRAVIKGQMSVGDLLAFYYGFGLIREYLRNVYNSIPDLIEGNQSLVSLWNILSIQDSIPYSGTKKINFNGDISLESVNFRYSSDFSLNKVTLNLDSEKIKALVGPSGAGKSTIINLILGFYRPQKGRILAEKIPYDDLDLRDLRKQIGVVPQEPLLFSGTVRENISYGLNKITQEEVVFASKLAIAHNFIDRLPHGYETQIGEGGVLLSGGQCQRLAIARALIRRPSLLILDEPTNHLDPIIIKNFLQNLKTYYRMISILIVSHDEKVIGEADYIYLLEHGTIVEEGQTSLIKKKEKYNILFNPRTAQA